MNFLAPQRLWLLLAVGALVAVYVGFLVRRKRYAVRFTNLDLLDSVAPRRPGWRRHVPAGLAGLSAIAMVIGMAQPTIERTVSTESAIVVLAIDTSTSMDAVDVAPTRMQAAIDEAVTFIDGLPDTVEVGLVAFDGTARVLATPTTEHEAVAASIVQLTTGRGTAGGDAIDASLQSIDAALAEPSAFASVVGPTDEPSGDAATDDPPATIVFLSDGVSTSGIDIVQAATDAGEAGIPISTITYGTATGTVDVGGQTASVPPDAATMTRIAELTGGTAFEAADAEQLRTVYEQLDARITTETEEQEITVAFVAGAFAALLIAAGAAFVWTGRFI
jgi:Ca-activated chloride channel homolog